MKKISALILMLLQVMPAYAMLAPSQDSTSEQVPVIALQDEPAAPALAPETNTEPPLAMGSDMVPGGALYSAENPPIVDAPIMDTPSTENVMPTAVAPVVETETINPVMTDPISGETQVENSISAEDFFNLSDSEANALNGPELDLSAIDLSTLDTEPNDTLISFNADQPKAKTKEDLLAEKVLKELLDLVKKGLVLSKDARDQIMKQYIDQLALLEKNKAELEKITEAGAAKLAHKLGATEKDFEAKLKEALKINSPIRIDGGEAISVIVTKDMLSEDDFKKLSKDLQDAITNGRVTVKLYYAVEFSLDAKGNIKMTIGRPIITFDVAPRTVD